MTLRARLLLGIAVVAVVLGAVAWSITRSTEAELVDQIDRQLERADQELRGPALLFGLGDGAGDGVGRPGRDGERDPRGLPPTAFYIGLVDEDAGTITALLRPGTTRDDAEPGLSVAAALDRLGSGPFTVGATEGDGRFRAVVRTVGPDADRVAVVALSLDDVDETVDRLLVVQGIGAVAILAVLGLVVFWVLRLGVRPIREMTETAAAIGQGDLSHRVPEAQAGTEAGELGVALNQMLGRIEDAFDQRARSEDRLRQFVADASHELRTPVTTIRGYAELYRMGGLADDEAVSEAMRRTEQEATRMGALVADLLALARMDQGRPIERTRLGLHVLAADAVADARAVEPDRPISLDIDGEVWVDADEAHLRQLLANLLANVRVHTPRGAPAHVRVRAEGGGGPSATATGVGAGGAPRASEGQAVLEVTDEGPGMAPDVAERVFERFYRADPSRARDHGGSGLGLSIVAASVAAHGGRVEVDSAPGRGTTFRVRLPLADPPS